MVSCYVAPQDGLFGTGQHLKVVSMPSGLTRGTKRMVGQVYSRHIDPSMPDMTGSD